MESQHKQITTESLGKLRVGEMAFSKKEYTMLFRTKCYYATKLHILCWLY